MPEQTAPYASHRRRWPVIAGLLLLLLSSTSLAGLALAQPEAAVLEDDLPLSLHAAHPANYAADPLAMEVAAVDLGLIREIIQDDESNAAEVEARLATLAAALGTPLGTAGPTAPATADAPATATQPAEASALPALPATTTPEPGARGFAIASDHGPGNRNGHGERARDGHGSPHGRRNTSAGANSQPDANPCVDFHNRVDRDRVRDPHAVIHQLRTGAHADTRAACLGDHAAFRHRRAAHRYGGAGEYVSAADCNGSALGYRCADQHA